MIEIKRLKDGRLVTAERIDDEHVRLLADGQELDIATKGIGGRFVIQTTAVRPGVEITHRIGKVGLTTEEAHNVKAALGELPRERTEADKARSAIDKMFDEAERYKDSDYSRYLELDKKAREARREWRENYPAEAREERDAAADEQARRDALNADAVARKLRMED